ncbi:MAG: 16S rRNA (guanine(527)-N(7))-methyltransferase RsmG, partial [Rubrobacteraceae bacterium]
LSTEHELCGIIQTEVFHVKPDFEEVEKIRTQASDWGVEVSLEDASLLVKYAELLDTYKEANVIGTHGLAEIVENHIIDSLGCLLFDPLRDARGVVDVGSGGGLPGIPLGVLLAEAEVRLIEATKKKTRFLAVAAEELDASNIRISNGRVEEVGRSEKFRGRYDIATARALASLDVLVEYCLPLVKVGGYVVAMKGRLEDGEFERGRIAAKLLGADVAEVTGVPRISGCEQKDRRLVVFEKLSPTPGGYPRRTGIPSKRPLGTSGNR